MIYRDNSLDQQELVIYSIISMVAERPAAAQDPGKPFLDPEQQTAVLVSFEHLGDQLQPTGTTVALTNSWRT